MFSYLSSSNIFYRCLLVVYTFLYIYRCKTILYICRKLCLYFIVHHLKNLSWTCLLQQIELTGVNAGQIIGSIYTDTCCIGEIKVAMNYKEMIGVLGIILYCKATLTRGQPGVMRWRFSMEHDPGERLIAWPVDLQPSVLPVCYGWPLKLQEMHHTLAL